MLTGLHLLIVEDTPLNAELTGEIVRAAGASFDLALDGALAIEAVRRVAYALVLMDCQLPRVDGYEATRRIRAIPELAAVPIIAVTSYALSGDEAKTREAGCDGYVAKPFSPRQLLAKVREFLPE
jgi:two-component system, cell cycle response regulator DivK